jgi:hypothetical protein
MIVQKDVDAKTNEITQAIRNQVIGAFRRAGYTNIADARRYHTRDERCILALYGYTPARSSLAGVGDHPAMTYC